MSTITRRPTSQADALSTEQREEIRLHADAIRRDLALNVWGSLAAQLLVGAVLCFAFGVEPVAGVWMLGWLLRSPAAIRNLLKSRSWYLSIIARLALANSLEQAQEVLEEYGRGIDAARPAGRMVAKAVTSAAKFMTRSSRHEQEPVKSRALGQNEIGPEKNRTPKRVTQPTRGK